MTKPPKRLFIFSLILAGIVRLILQLIAIPAIKYIPFKGSFPYWETILADRGPDWLWFWGNFDGVHYLNIAKINYQYGLTQAFFPLYPVLIKIVNFIINNSLWSALIISHLSFIGFIYLFIKLGRFDFKSKSVKWASILLLLFPTSFFFFGVYTESLFLLLTAACFYYSRQKKFLLASILAGLASATRLIGIFLLPVILWEYYQSVKKPRLTKLTLISLISSSGLLVYLAYLQKHFNDFLIFINSQPGFGAGRQVDKLIMIYQVIFRYIKMLTTVSPQNEIYPVLAFELLASMAFIGLIIYAFIKKLRLSYLIFIIPALLLPTLTGSFSSMPRYALAAFPLFYLLGNLKSKYKKASLAVAFALILTWAFIRFARGYWLA